MSQSSRTWTVLILAVLILLLLLWLLKKRAGMMTNTSVNLGGTDITQFPTRNETNNRLLRICTYDSGEILSLDPNAVGGRCPPVYTDIAGKTGNLLKDEIITLPQAGSTANNPGGVQI